MGRVIWKARDTPGSWEVLHTSQASTSWLLSISVYQVKVANSPNWPLKCKMQYMFDVVQYEVNESESSHPGVKPRTHGLSCQCSHHWATTTRQPPALTILCMAVCFSCVPSSHSVWYAFLSFTYNIKHVCMFQLRQEYKDIQFFSHSVWNREVLCRIRLIVSGSVHSKDTHCSYNSVVISCAVSFDWDFNFS